MVADRDKVVSNLHSAIGALQKEVEVCAYLSCLSRQRWEEEMEEDEEDEDEEEKEVEDEEVVEELVERSKFREADPL
jgi:hypothetical protein